MEFSKTCVFLCVLCSLFSVDLRFVNASTTTFNLDTSSTTVPPAINSTSTNDTYTGLPSLFPLAAKIPGGLDGATLLPLLISSGSLDLTTLTQLLTSLAPQLPTLLRDVLETNTSGMADAEKTCHEDMELFLDEVFQTKMWAISMLDASGKPGPSLMKGSVKFYGDFDECLEVTSGASPVTGRTVNGDTCVATLTPPPQLLSFVGELPELLTTSFAFKWHMCVPDTCGSRSIQAGLQNALNAVGINVTTVVCHSEVKAGPVGHDAVAVAAIVLSAILGFLVLLGTILDLSKRVDKARAEKEGRQSGVKMTIDTFSKLVLENDKPVNGIVANNDASETGKANGIVDAKVTAVSVELTDAKSQSPSVAATKEVSKPTEHVPLWHKLLLCFSAVSNGERILSVKTTPGSLTCLNGIRVLSMGWVILGHTFSFLIPIAAKPKDAADIMQTLSFQVILNGTLSVDSFFVLSGVLVTYLFLRETEKLGGVKIKQMVLYYVHRYLRLTPAYAFVIFINACLVRYLNDGPTWTGPYDKEFCRKHWYQNLLYVNNLIAPLEQCLGWGWFLAIDMQCYIIIPLALIPLFYSKRPRTGVYMKAIGLSVLMALVIVGISTTAYEVHDINGSLVHNTMPYMERVYLKTWCRVAPYAIGVATGYLLHTTRCKIKMSLFLQGVGWFLAFVAAGACTLSTYDQNGPGRSPWGPAATTAHETLFRPVWALVVSWVILMCCTEKAGLINWMLSWPWWQPLARLTYGAFLVHPVLISLNDENASTRLILYTVPNLVNRFFGYACISYILAFLLAILVEAPFLQLEKVLLKK